MSAPTFALYKQYSVYKYFSRSNDEDFDAFMDKYEQLRKETEDKIYHQCSRMQIQILDLLAVCNLANDDVENILRSIDAGCHDNLYEKTKESVIEIAKELQDLPETKIECEDEPPINFTEEPEYAIEKKETDEYDDDSQDQEHNSFDDENNANDDDLSFLMKSRINHYLLYKQSNKTLKWYCDVCGKGFAKAQYVSLHKTSKRHRRCFYESEVMKKLMSERELNHNKVGERVHTSDSNCTVIKFTQDKVTEDTQNTPSNDAEDLEYSFKTKVSRSRSKYKQTKSGRYLCDVCGKSFARTYNVDLHKNAKNSKCLTKTSVKDVDDESSNKEDAVSNEKGGSFVKDDESSNKEDTVSNEKAQDIKRPLSGSVQSGGVIQLFEKTCKYCGKTFADRKRLKIHIKDTHSSRRFQCQTCGKLLKTKRLLNRHKEREHTEKDTSHQLKCDKCDYSTYVKLNLMNHLKHVHEPKTFACEQCGILFATSSRLRLHIECVHNKTIVACPFCDFQGSAQSLETHIQKTHTKAFGKFVCPSCGFEASDSGTLQDHMQIEHGGDIVEFKIPKKPNRNYDCDQCDHRANSKNALRAHKSFHHWHVSFKCQECGISKSTKERLQFHINRVHRKISYPCDFCDFKASSKPTLKRHIEKKHPNNFQLYYCHLCNYRTQYKDLLQSHLTGKYGKHGNLNTNI